MPLVARPDEEVGLSVQALRQLAPGADDLIDVVLRARPCSSATRIDLRRVLVDAGQEERLRRRAAAGAGRGCRRRRSCRRDRCAACGSRSRSALSGSSASALHDRSSAFGCTAAAPPAPSATRERAYRRPRAARPTGAADVRGGRPSCDTEITARSRWAPTAVTIVSGAHRAIAADAEERRRHGQRPVDESAAA